MSRSSGGNFIEATRGSARAPSMSPKVAFGAGIDRRLPNQRHGTPVSALLAQRTRKPVWPRTSLESAPGALFENDRPERC